jgi:hypothetical protein
MTEFKKIFAGKDYPHWLKENKIFDQFKEVQKIFPDIGLSNCEKEIELDNSKEINDAAVALMGRISCFISIRITDLTSYANRNNFDDERKKKYELCKNVLSLLKSQLKKPRNLLKDDGKKITINLSKDILVDKKPYYKKNEGLFKVYNKINELLRSGKFIAMEKLDNIQEFKNFSFKNIPNRKYKIVFSSNDNDGVWDIATMSMRGISSCMSWDSANSRQLIGSIADPFTAIIYLTSGEKTDKGTKMLRRCVVRFLVDRKRKVPFIGIEKMYPSMDSSTYKSFIAFLEERTKLNVKYLPNYPHSNSYIPKSKQIKSLNDEYQSYTDSGIEYDTDFNDLQQQLMDDIEENKSTLENLFTKKILSFLKKIKLSDVDETSKQGLKDIRCYNRQTYRNYTYLIDDAMSIYFEDIASKIDASKYSDIVSWQKDLYNSLKIDLESALNTKLKIIRNGGSTYSISHMTNNSIDYISKFVADKMLEYLNDQINKIKPPKIKLLHKINKYENVISLYTKYL